MSEYAQNEKGLVATETFVTDEHTYTLQDTQEVRVVCTSGTITTNIPYVAADWQSDTPVDEFSVATMTAGDVRVFQLSGSGIYRGEAGNKAGAATAGVSFVWSARDTKTKIPLIKRGMIRRYSNGITRRSA